MASFKFDLKSKPNKDGKYTIQLILIKDRKNTSVSIKKSVLKYDWETTTERVKKSDKNHKRINGWIETLEKRADDYLKQMENNATPFTLDSWSSHIKRKPKSQGVTFKTLANEIIEELNNSNQISHALLYNTASNRYLKFCNENDVTFNEITYSKLIKFQSELIADDLSSETIKNYFAYIRSIYKEAIKRELIHAKLNPFKEFKIKVRENIQKKEYFTKEELERFISFESENPKLILAKKLFLLSYYSYGCNFIDLTKLKTANVHEQEITYRRTKTGVFVNFPITDKSKSLWDEFKEKATDDFLLPFSNFKGSPNSAEGIEYYKTLSKKALSTKVNPQLKKICKELEIDKNITFYCARHTFATHMKLANINIDIIRQALGHKSITSTANYLHQLPTNIMMEQLQGAFV